jgi:hypothetical protein
MTSFQFPLQRALDWRRTQLELAEARLHQQLAALAELDRARAGLEAEGDRTEVEVREYNPLAGQDLTALGSFRLLLQARQKEIAGRRLECEWELAARKSALLEARRRCRLLEQLKETRWAEWQLARDRELEELASESYLARWVRRAERPAFSP